MADSTLLEETKKAPVLSHAKRAERLLQSASSRYESDEKKDANRIDDDILDAITQSRFVVADMTHGSDGVRGSVYFEAGFAHGLGLEVIYCCRRDCIDRLPFDTRQYHHIVWDTPQQLRTELAERISARVGSSASGAK